MEEQRPSSLEIWKSTFESGEKALEEKRFEEAIDFFQLPVGKSNMLIESFAFYSLGRVHFRKNDLKEAVPYFEKAHTQSSSPRVKWMAAIALGEIKEKQNYHEEAKKYYLTAHCQNEDSWVGNVKNRT